MIEGWYRRRKKKKKKKKKKQNTNNAEGKKKKYICEWERRENIGALDSKKKNTKASQNQNLKIENSFLLPSSRKVALYQHLVDIELSIPI